MTVYPVRLFKHIFRNTNLFRVLFLNQVLRRLNNDISKNFITVENYSYKRMYAKSASEVHPHHLLIISPSTPSHLAFVAFLSWMNAI
jgi:hypothetical protein